MSRPDAEPSLHDDAARAGWLYYVGGMTQDQIAAELGISRQRAQRLVSRAMAEGLIQVRLNHRIGACLELEASLRDRFGLDRVRFAPGLGADGDFRIHEDISELDRVGSIRRGAHGASAQRRPATPHGPCRWCAASRARAPLAQRDPYPG